MNLRLAAENKFAGCKREELVVYCTVLGIEVLEGHNTSHLVKKLLDTLGHYNELNVGDAEEQVVEEVALADMNLVDLNLSSNGKWQGRRRIVTLHRAAAYTTLFPLFLGWEHLHVYLPYGVTASLPWPIWKILECTSSAKKLVRKRHMDADGRIAYIEEWLPDQPFMYTDGGTDPDTALLPGTMMEAVKMIYAASKGFENFNVQQLRELCRRLRIMTPREWSPEDMIGAMQDCLGISTALDDATGGLTAAGMAAQAG